MKENKRTTGKEILNVAFFISGNGTTAQAVIKEAQAENLSINPVLVIADRPAPGLLKAEQLGISTQLVRKSEFKSNEDFGKALLELLISRYSIDLVIQCGWLSFTPPNITRYFSGNIVNQHPGPLDANRPDFGGKGMYGARVIAARLWYLVLCCQDFGFAEEEMWTEATTHLVTPIIDGGQIVRTERLDLSAILPEQILVLLAKNSDLLISFSRQIQKMLLPIEHHNVIETLRLFAKKKDLTQYQRKLPLIPSHKVKHLNQAKQFAIDIFEKNNL